MASSPRSTRSTKRIALITGSNSGVGLALAKRLVEDYGESIKVILACRSASKAEEAKQDIIKFAQSVNAHRGSNDHSSNLETEMKSSHFPDIDIVSIDVSSPKSVMQCVKVIKERYSKIDLLYLNAGVMFVNGVNWAGLLTNPKELAHRVTTGEKMLKFLDYDTPDGLKMVFAANLFGHFILAHELLPLLSKSNDAKIIWTCSHAANPRSFSILDFQHAKGSDPYGSSKHAIDLVSFAMNRHFAKKGIANVESFVTCPGLVTTQMTEAFLSPFIWTLLLPILFIFRIFVHSMTTVPYVGSEALVWLSHKANSELPPQAEKPIKFSSRYTVLGRRYVYEENLSAKLNEEEADKLYTELDVLSKTFTS